MIMRVFQVTAREGKEEEFRDFSYDTAIPLTKETEGIVQVLPGAPRPESPTEFSFVTIWKDMAALRAFVEEDCRTPHINPAEAELVASRSIKHYEFVE